jgi:hypothetical protein
VTKFDLVMVIACGYVVGEIALELLGTLFNWAGKMVGTAIASAAKRMIAARGEQAAAEQPVVLR